MIFEDIAMKNLKFLIFILLLLTPIISKSGSVVIIDPSNEASSSTTTTIETFSESEGSFNNCGVYISGTTLTIKGSDDNSLSESAPCKIGIVSNDSGKNKTATFNSNVTVTFGSSSNTDGNLFGITDANWSDAMPLFLGVVADPTSGSNDFFTLSRKPLTTTGSTVATMCILGDTDCDAETDVMILTSTPLSLAAWVNQPITQALWISATYATSGSAWTFSLDNNAGFNSFFESVSFSFPVAQKGASAGTYFKANGGTAPLFTGNSFLYKIDKNLNVCHYVALYSDPGTDGAGAVVSYLATPYIPTGTNAYSGSYQVNSTGGAAANQFVLGYLNGSTGMALLEGSGGFQQNSDFSNGSRNVYGTSCYSIF